MEMSIEKGKMKTMRDEYDFNRGKKNPYTKVLKKQMTIDLNDEIVDSFKSQSTEYGIPYQTLIKQYLQDCVNRKAKPKLEWRSFNLKG